MHTGHKDVDDSNITVYTITLCVRTGHKDANSITVDTRVLYLCKSQSY